jgi:hypothetical protein
MTDPAIPTSYKLVAIRRQRDTRELRVSFTADAIRAAHLAELNALPSQPIINARIEATAYYASDMDDAIDTSLAMMDSALANPSSLVAERDLPSHTQLHGSSVESRKAFQSLIANLPGSYQQQQ